MSRIRSVHPGFFTDEDLVSVSMAARLLFIGLGVEADDKGVFVWKPLTIKMRVFPADNVDVAILLSELLEAGLIKQYSVDEKSYGAIKNFRKYQRPKTPNDIHPTTNDVLNYVGLEAVVSETKDVKQTPFPPKGEKSPQMEEEGGREGGDKEPSGSSSKRASAPAKPQKPKSVNTPFPEIFEPKPFNEGTISHRIFGGWPQGRIDTELERFAANHRQRGTMMKDWQSAWSTWVLNTEKFGKPNNGNGNYHNQSDTGPVSPMVQAIAARQAKRAGEQQRQSGGNAGGWSSDGGDPQRFL